MALVCGCVYLHTEVTRSMHYFPTLLAAVSRSCAAVCGKWVGKIVFS